MKPFLQKNKIVVVIILGALIVAFAVYLALSGNLIGGEGENNVSCLDIPSLPDNSIKMVTKVIDGDTIIIEGGQSVRIIGIDTDERGYPCYDVAKNRLEELVLNKEVRLEKSVEDLDQYCRYLRYILLDNKNIGLQMVSEGLAVARFYPENVKYRSEIELAEQEAKDKEIGCKWGGIGATTEDNTNTANLSWDKLTTGKIVGSCQAGNYYNQEITIEGKIVDAYNSKTNTVFLNFDKPYPNSCFTAVIFSSDQYKFVSSPEDYYSGKTVRIKGEVIEYQGKPEIILNNPEQIEVGD